MKPIDYRVGQPVYVSERYGRRGLSKCQVLNVGRKWVHLEDGTRIHIGTRHTEHGRGEVWASEEEYREEVELSKAWDALRHDLPYRRPVEVTLVDIMHVRSVLGLPEQDEKDG